MGWTDEAHKAIDEFSRNLKDRLIYGTQKKKDSLEDASSEVNPPKEEDEEKKSESGFVKAAKVVK